VIVFGGLGFFPPLRDDSHHRSNDWTQKHWQRPGPVFSKPSRGEAEIVSQNSHVESSTGAFFQRKACPDLIRGQKVRVKKTRQINK